MMEYQSLSKCCFFFQIMEYQSFFNNHYPIDDDGWRMIVFFLQMSEPTEPGKHLPRRTGARERPETEPSGMAAQVQLEGWRGCKGPVASLFGKYGQVHIFMFILILIYILYADIFQRRVEHIIFENCQNIREQKSEKEPPLVSQIGKLRMRTSSIHASGLCPMTKTRPPTIRPFKSWVRVAGRVDLKRF